MALYNPGAGQTDWRKQLKSVTQQPPAVSTGGQMAGLGGTQQPQARTTQTTQPSQQSAVYNASASPSASFSNPDNNNWGMTPDSSQGAPQMYPTSGGGGYYSDGSSYGGGGWASGFEPSNGRNPTMSRDQQAQYQQNYTQGWASNSLIAPESSGAFGQDAHAWSVAYQKRAAEAGYPSGSYGQVTRNRGVDWISPDGVGPNGEVGHYSSFGASGTVDPRTGIDWGVNPETGKRDSDLTPEEFLQYRREWVQAYADDPAALQAALANGQDPIWQHIDPADLQTAIGLLQGGGTNNPNNMTPDPTVVQEFDKDKKRRNNNNGNGNKNKGGGGGNGGRPNGPHGGSGYGPQGQQGPGGGRPNGGGGNRGGGGNKNNNNGGGNKNNNKKK